MKKLIIIALMLVGFSIQAQEYFNSTQHGSYELYEYKYKKAKKGMVIGEILTGTGVGVFILSNVMLGSSTDVYGELNMDDPMVTVAGIGLIYSFVAFNVGMPLWMSNFAKKKANKKAMENYKGYTGPKEISLGATKNGIGLIVKL